MPYIADERPSYPTLTDALQQYTVDYLKKLAVLASDDKNKPTRKADLIQFIVRHLNCEPGRLRQVEDDPLQGFWRQLDPLQQATVAEVAHGPDGCFNSARFTAKYGQSPNWGEKKPFDYLPVVPLNFRDEFAPC